MASGAFAVVGEAGPGRFFVHRFGTDAEARTKGSKLWCCWCAFHLGEDGTPAEIASGGVGWSHDSIRKHANATFKSQARDVDARRAAAAAAEARFASSAQPAKPKPKAAAAAADGKPDLANAATWD